MMERPHDVGIRLYGKEGSQDKSSGTGLRDDSGAGLREEWLSFAEGIAISGAKYAADGRQPPIRRLIWTLLILLGFGLMSYQLIERVAFYYTYPSNTLLIRKYPRELRFPTITLCNENRISRTKATAFGLDTMFDSMFPPFYVYLKPPDFSVLNAINESINWEYAYANLSAFFIDEMMSYIMAHEPREFPDIYMKGTFIPTGQATNIVLQKTKVTLLPPPYGTCDPGAQLRYSKDYSVEACFNECSMIFITELCHCIFYPYIDKLRSLGLPVCSPLDEAVCILPNIVEFYIKRLDANCSCPAPCSTTEYRLELSSAPINDRALGYLRSVFFPKNEVDFLRRNVVVSSIFYPSLSYTEITQEKDYDIFTLFCDMGGALGLLLGSTFLTVYEFVDFVIFYMLKQRKNK